MIVSMKKTAIIVQSKDADACLYKLRSLGILHVEYSQPATGEDITGLKEDLSLLTTAIDIISNPLYIKLANRGKTKSAAWKSASRHIVDLSKRLQQLEDYSRVLSGIITEWEGWGDFDPHEIERLKEKNIYIRLYQIPVKEVERQSRSVEQMSSGVIMKEIFRRAGFAHCVMVSQGKPDLPFKEIPLPKMGLERARARAREDQRMKELITEDMRRCTAYLQELVEAKKNLEKKLEFQEALRGMAGQGGILYATGYIPFDQVHNLEQAAREAQWGLSVQEPSDEDTPPVLLRNPRWVRLIEPVLKLLGIAPGYRELDVSPVFLVFFSVFFGILIGDAGYGLVYFLLTLWFQKKRGRNPSNANIFYLFYVLSSSAIIWGVLTGTFFGQAWLIERGIRPLLPALNNPGLMQRFCFFIGALHLTIAHAWRGLLKFPRPAFLADTGWIAVLWASFFLAATLILGQPFPAWAKPLAVCGIILVLFFSEPRKNVLKGLGAGFTSVTFGLSFMSAFTDVVSYVRLFAVGLAGVAIADTTNAMAVSLGTGVIGLGAGGLIRILGHALNIVLGPIAILVHGVRLNVLEFGLNHTNITWSGCAYKPLAE